MIAIPAGMRVFLAMGPTDMRKGFDGLSVLAQETLNQGTPPVRAALRG